MNKPTYPAAHPPLVADWHSDYGEGVRASVTTDENRLPFISINRINDAGELLHRDGTPCCQADYQLAKVVQVTIRLWLLTVTVLAEAHSWGLKLSIIRSGGIGNEGGVCAVIKKSWRMEIALPSSRKVPTN
jgi:hypothetical protein